jgi:hypothetical protein
MQRDLLALECQRHKAARETLRQACEELESDLDVMEKEREEARREAEELRERLCSRQRGTLGWPKFSWELAEGAGPQPKEVDAAGPGWTLTTERGDAHRELDQLFPAMNDLRVLMEIARRLPPREGWDTFAKPCPLCGTYSMGEREAEEEVRLADFILARLAEPEPTPDLRAVPERDVEVAVLRKLLFLHHHKGCYLKGSYTDDGELQCHGCGVDFRRIDVVELERQWMMKGLASLAAPERPALDREALAALICEWNEGDALHRPTEEEVRLADFILARLEADRGK